MSITPAAAKILCRIAPAYSNSSSAGSSCASAIDRAPPPSNARISSHRRVDVVATGVAHQAAGSDGTIWPVSEPVEPMTDRQEAIPGAPFQGGNDPCALANDRSPSRAVVEFHRHRMTGNGRSEPVVVGLSSAIYGHSPALSHGHSNVGSTTRHRTFVRGSYRSRRGADGHRGSRARTGNGGRGRPSICSRSQGMRAFLAARHFGSRRSISACWISRSGELF